MRFKEEMSRKKEKGTQKHYVKAVHEQRQASKSDQGELDISGYYCTCSHVYGVISMLWNSIPAKNQRGVAYPLGQTYCKSASQAC